MGLVFRSAQQFQFLEEPGFCVNVGYKKPDNGTKRKLNQKDNIQGKETSFVLKFSMISQKNLHVLRENFLTHLKRDEPNATGVIA